MSDERHDNPEATADAAAEAVADPIADAPAEPIGGQADAPFDAQVAADDEAAVQAPTPDAAPADPAASAPLAETAPDAGHAGVTCRVGTVKAIRDEQVTVEFGGSELGVCPVSTFHKTPRIGQHFEFAILSTAADGVHQIALADREYTSWDKIKQGDVIEALVTCMNVGGLELKIPGLKTRAFMPVSLIDLNRADDLTPYLNRKLRCRIIEINRKKKRIVLSRRSILEAEHREKRLGQIKSNDVLEGVVRKIENFGVFVQIEPGLDGLVRLSDLSWSDFNDPNEVVKIGQRIQAKVLSIDAHRGRIALGVRQAQPNPWQAIAQKYPLDSEQTGRVTRVTEFGAFVELEPGVEGMIHISQLAERRVERVEQVVREGMQVKAKVTQVDPGKRRIGLSIRALTAPPRRELHEASREDIRRFVKSADKAKAVSRLMIGGGGGDGLKGGLG